MRQPRRVTDPSLPSEPSSEQRSVALIVAVSLVIILFFIAVLVEMTHPGYFSGHFN